LAAPYGISSTVSSGEELETGLGGGGAAEPFAMPHDGSRRAFTFTETGAEFGEKG
jgi:hypothetical protein